MKPFDDHGASITPKHPTAAAATLDLPAADALEQWIAPTYWSAYQAGTLKSDWVATQPFEHVALPDFFRPQVFEQVARICEAMPTESFFEGDKAINQGFLQHPGLLRFIFGPAFRGFLAALAGGPLVRPVAGDVAATAFPQVRHYVRGSVGLRPHTDEDEGFDVGMVLYLSPGWRPECGGEVSLYRPVGRLLVEDKTILPLQNSLMLLFFSSRSHHRVQQVAEHWGRSTLSMGWQTVARAQHAAPHAREAGPAAALAAAAL